MAEMFNRENGVQANVEHAMKKVASKGGDMLPQTSNDKGLENGLLGEIAGSFPSDTFLWLTLGSIALSASVKIAGRSKDANFFGEWAPTFLALGIFSKLKKIEQEIIKLR